MEEMDDFKTLYENGSYDFNASGYFQGVENGMVTTPTTDTAGPGESVARTAAILVPVIFSIIFLVGLIGNSLVITVMTRIYRYQGQGLNNTNRFILNLAVSDLTFLVICVPFQAPIYTLPHWVFGSFMCVFTYVFQELAMIASIYTLVALSIDRFLAVAYATSSKNIRNKKNSLRGLIFIWISAIGIAAPSALTRIQITYNGKELCIPNWRMKSWFNIYQLSVFILGYVLPLFVILGCYMGLLCAMCRNARKNAVSARSRSSVESRKKVTRIVILVVIVFAICWFPHHFATLWMLYGDFKFTSFTFGFRLLAHCLSYANACMNPLIYAFVSNKFRQDMKKVFTCKIFVDFASGTKKCRTSLFGHTGRSRTSRRNNKQKFASKNKALIVSCEGEQTTIGQTNTHQIDQYTQGMARPSLGFSTHHDVTMFG